MFAKVVVGVDGSPQSLEAIALARALSPDGALTLVNAYPYDTRPSRMANLGWRDALRDDSLKLLESAREEAGVEAELKVIPDVSPARGLHKVAAEVGADLLVVGPAHHGGAGRVMLGDVGRSTMHGSPCPVAVPARQGGDGTRGAIAVAFDGSPESREALVLGAGLARERGATLRVVTVVKPSGEVVAPMYPFTHEAKSWHEETEAEQLHSQRLAEQAIADVGASAEPEIVLGSPSEALEAISPHVDLIVVGSRGWGAVRQVVLGSTSHRLAHSAACPILVVPRGAESADDDVSTQTEAAPA